MADSIILYIDVNASSPLSFDISSCKTLTNLFFDFAERWFGEEFKCLSFYHKTMYVCLIKLTYQSGEIISPGDTQIRETTLSNGDTIFARLRYPLHAFRFGFKSLCEKNIEVNTDNILLEAVKKYPEIVSRFTVLTRDERAAFLRSNLETFEYLRNVKNESFYFFAIVNDVRILKVIPESEMSHRVIVFSINKCPDSINDVPEHLLTEKIRKIYLRNNFQRSYNEDLDSEEICLESISRFKEMPKCLRTQRVCDKAIRSGATLKDIPEHFLTEDMCLEAVKRGQRIQDIPENLLTEELCFCFASKHPLRIDTIPEHLLTERIKKIAIKNNYVFETFYHENLTSEEMCFWNTHFFNMFPKCFKTYRVCLGAILEGKDIKGVPEHLLTEELCLEAVKRGQKLQDIPERFRTKAICLELISLLLLLDHCTPSQKEKILGDSKIFDNFKLIPESFLSEELCSELVKNCPRIIELIPEQFK